MPEPLVFEVVTDPAPAPQLPENPYPPFHPEQRKQLEQIIRSNPVIFTE